MVCYNINACKTAFFEYMDFIGQEKVVNFFDNALAGGQLAHAYCFVGQEGMGKRTLARRLAARLLGAEEGKLDIHPDFIFLHRETDEKTGKFKKDISVRQARDLRERLQHRSWTGGYQVVIIDEAGLLNEEAGNALLKILEEPSQKTIFFLLAVNDLTLLPTVRSRCQSLYFSLAPLEDIAVGLRALGCSAERAQQLAGWSWGRPGRAIELFRSEEVAEDYAQEVSRWRRMLAEPFYAKIKDSQELFGDKSDHIKERGNLQKVVDIWTMLWRDALLSQCGSGFLTHSDLIEDKRELAYLSRERILNVMDSLEEARQMLGQNIHPRLLVEQVLLKI